MLDGKEMTATSLMDEKVEPYIRNITPYVSPNDVYNKSMIKQNNNFPLLIQELQGFYDQN